MNLAQFLYLSFICMIPEAAKIVACNISWSSMCMLKYVKFCQYLSLHDMLHSLGLSLNKFHVMYKEAFISGRE